MSEKRTRKPTRPNLATIDALLEKKATAIKLLQEIEDETFDMLQKYGEVRFDYELDIPRKNAKDKDCYCLKFEIINNLRKASEGETVVSISVFKNTVYDSSLLIKAPKN